MERDIAVIEPSTLLDETLFDTLIEEDDGTPVVFYCHHGIRSASAAAFFAHKGLQRAINLEGGIDAWSAAIDPDVDRY
jgi:rhodanese-related sulfurtransferase